MAFNREPEWRIYKEQMASWSRGDALWPPAPTHDYRCISIGDVGFIRRGQFHLLFSASRSREKQLEREVPGSFVEIQPDFTETTPGKSREPGCLRTDIVREFGAKIGVSVSAAIPLELDVSCSFNLAKERGAALVTKYQTRVRDALKDAAFEEYTKKHYASWVAFSREKKYGSDVKPVLVTGVDVTKEFAMVAYSNEGTSPAADPPVSLPMFTSPSAAVWGEWRTKGLAHTNHGPQPCIPPSPAQTVGVPSRSTTTETVSDDYNQCVFVRYYTMRTRRVFFPKVMRAAAGPHDLGSGQNYDSAFPELTAQPGDPESGDGDFEPNIVVRNTPDEERYDEFDAVADYVFQNSNATSALMHHEDLTDIRALGGVGNIPSLLAKNLPRVVVDESGVGRIVCRGDLNQQSPNPVATFPQRFFRSVLRRLPLARKVKPRSAATSRTGSGYPSVQTTQEGSPNLPAEALDKAMSPAVDSPAGATLGDRIPYASGGFEDTRTGQLEGNDVWMNRAQDLEAETVYSQRESPANHRANSASTSPSDPIQLLWDLVRSPLRSPDQLTSILVAVDWVNRAQDLQEQELNQLVESLDETLNILNPTSPAFCRCLSDLRRICAAHGLLPRSHVLRCVPLDVSDHPVASGTSADVYRGTLYGSDECVEVRMGQAYFGEEGIGATDVCVKVMKAEKVHNEFYGVVVLWVKLDHPNILRCFGVTADPLQIVTKWMPNGQAMKYVQGRQRADRIRLLIGIACGLDYLHSHGLAHGNLKQKSILVDPTGKACLSDVGLAKLVPTGESGFDWADAGVGGCRWAAPEIFQSGKLSKESDVFSYGFVAAEIFTGEFLWRESDGAEVRSRILEDDRPHLPEGKMPQSLTTEVWRMSAKCWGKDPACRIRISGALMFLQRLIPQDSSPSDILGKSIQEQIDDVDKVGVESDMISPEDKYDGLNMLGKMCSHECSLPRSMVITSGLWIKSTMATYSGRFADVYRGEHDGRPAAIKVIRLYVHSDQNLSLSRFCREAVIWRHLRHPNILPLLGATLDTHETTFSLVSEWMGNGNINEFIRNHGDVNRVQLLVDVAHGLEYLHSFNLAHGNLKGAKILIKNDRRACLTDFGSTAIVHITTPTSIDRRLSTKTSTTSMNSKVSLMSYRSGEPTRWMSPELLFPELFDLSDDRPTTQSDCYALGMVVYEVLCGKPPFWDLKGHPTQAILQGVRPAKPAEATTLGFTDGLWWTVENCWMKDREMRPDVKALLRDLAYAAWAWDTRL